MTLSLNVKLINKILLLLANIGPILTDVGVGPNYCL